MANVLDYITLCVSAASASYPMVETTPDGGSLFVTVYAKRGSAANSASTVVARTFIPYYGKTLIFGTNSSDSNFYYAVGRTPGVIYTGSTNTTGTGTREAVLNMVFAYSDSRDGYQMLTYKDLYESVECGPNDYSNRCLTYDDFDHRFFFLGWEGEENQYSKLSKFRTVGSTQPGLRPAVNWFPTQTGGNFTGGFFPYFPNEYFIGNFNGTAASGTGRELYFCSNENQDYSFSVRVSIRTSAALTLEKGEALYVLSEMVTNRVLGLILLTFSNLGANSVLFNKTVPIGLTGNTFPISFNASLFVRAAGNVPSAQYSFLKCISPWYPVYLKTGYTAENGDTIANSITFNAAQTTRLTATTAQQRFIYINPSSTYGFKNFYTHFFSEWFNDYEEYTFSIELLNKEELLLSGFTFKELYINTSIYIVDSFDDSTDNLYSVGYGCPFYIRGATFNFSVYLPDLDIRQDLSITPNMASVSAAAEIIFPEQNFDKEIYIVLSNTGATARYISTGNISFRYSDDSTLITLGSWSDTVPANSKIQKSLTLPITTDRYASFIKAWRDNNTVKQTFRANKNAEFITFT